MVAFTLKTDDELAAMSIPDLLKHHTSVDDGPVKEYNTYKARVHEIITAKEKKLQAQKAVGRAQVFTPAADILDELKNLPEAALKKLRDYFKNGEK